MFTWISKPSEYGKITVASITELKEKIEALVCSAVHSGYYATHHATTTCSVTQSTAKSTVCDSHYYTYHIDYLSRHDTSDNSTYDGPEKGTHNSGEYSSDNSNHDVTIYD